MPEHEPATTARHRSRRRWIILLATAGIVVVLSCAGLVAVVFELIDKDRFDEHVVTGAGFDVRVLADREGGIGLNAPGGIYTYQWRASESGPWKTITAFRYRTPDPIPQGQITFIDENRAYFYHEFVFGVTVDGARTWTVRGEPELSFNALHQWRFPRIMDVQINADGTGRMFVKPYPWQTLNYSELVTEDYGLTWDQQQD